MEDSKTTESTDSGAPPSVGPYRVDLRIGVGGMGTVYRGFDTRLDRPVALKHLRADVGRTAAIDRFRREAKALAKLNHRTIVQIYDWVDWTNGSWIVMELVVGQTLRQVIEAGPLEPSEAIRILSEVTAGLDAAHQTGIVHRDLKPDNVMITEDGEVKVLDFGLAKPIEKATNDQSLTGEGRIVGTATAMSPEQAMGRPVDLRSDLFSLGLLLYEATTGISAFRGDNVVQTLTALCSTKHVPATQTVPDLPVELSKLIDHLLEKEPARRPASAREVLARLREIPVTGRREAARQATLATKFPSMVQTLTGGKPAFESASGSATGERRQLTVMSIEILEANGDSIGPEELAELFEDLEALATNMTQRWEAHLHTLRDHTIVVCFGYPIAHEAEACRALRAAEEFRRSLRRLSASQSIAIDARFGLHTDIAVITGSSTTKSATNRLILGSMLDLAEALRSSSRVGKISVSRATRQLVDTAFETHELEPFSIAGTNRSRKRYQIDGPRNQPTLETDLGMVARNEELALILGRWRRARAGTGNAVILTGIAGIGKSRLVKQAIDQLRSDQTLVRLIAGSRESQSSPLVPLIAMIENEAVGKRVSALADLERLLTKYALPLEQNIPLLAPLWAVPLDHRYRPSDLGPALHRQRTRDAIAALVFSICERTPSVLVIEDLHWIDAMTIDLIKQLVEQLEQLPLLIIMACRPEQVPTWPSEADVTQLQISRLDRDESLHLIRLVAGAVQIDPRLSELILERADGIPLYVEELTKAFLESGDLSDPHRLDFDQLDSSQLPVTLRDSLLARLDTLGPARHLALVASVFGRRFERDSLRSVARLPAAEADRLCERLTGSRLVVPSGPKSLRVLAFRHALIRDAAYDSLLPKERRTLHRRIATLLVERNDPDLERIARHHSRARQHREAARWWLAAGKRAVGRSGHRQGVQLFQRGIDSLEQLAEGSSNLELALLVQLAATSTVLRGYAAEELEGYWNRALELTDELEDSVDLFWIVWGLWSFHIVRADVRKAGELAERLASMSNKEDSTALRLVALATLGLTQYFEGDLASAITTLEQARAVDSDPARRQPIASASGQDNGVVVRAALALAQWHCGEDRLAVETCREGLELAERLEHSYSIAFAHAYAARLQQSRGQFDQLETHVEKVLSVSQQKGYFWASQGIFFDGCRLSEEVRRQQLAGTTGKQSRQRICDGIDAYTRTGARLSMTFMLGQLAEHDLAFGDVDSAELLISEAIAQLGATGERYWEPDLLRLKALVLERQGGSIDLIKHSFRSSLVVAHQHRDHAAWAKSALAFSDWLRRQDAPEQARKQLQEALALRLAQSQREQLEAALAHLA